MTVARILDQKGAGVLTVGQEASLQEAIDVLAEHQVGVLVVTGPGGDIAGILSERDVIRALSGNAAAATAKTAADIMTRAIRTCTPDETDATVMDRMNAAGIRHLPVLARGKLAGIISLRDVVRLRIEKIDDMMRNIEREAALVR